MAKIEQLKLSRRSFVKSSLAVAAAATVASKVDTEHALAETDTTDDTGGEIKRVRSCCRACGKMECGVWVTVQNGKAIKVEGDESALQSFGNCCTKSQASIQAAYHPDRILYPLKRTNPKGDSDPGWVRISWDEAYETVGQKVNELKEKYGGETFAQWSGTSRAWCQGAYGWIRQLTESPNSIIPWQVCKGPRHFATAMQSQMGAPWMATVDHPNVFVQWASATELSNYDDSCRTTVEVAQDADAHIVVDPRLTNNGKEATHWQHLRPNTDAALALSWINVIIENELYDDLFVKKWTNAPMLVCEDIEPSGFDFPRRISGTFEVKTQLLKESDLIEGGSPYRFMVWDEIGNKLTYYDADARRWEGETWEVPTKGKEAQQKNLHPKSSQGFVIDPTPFDPLIDPALYGEFEVTLKDGRQVKVKPVWEYFADRAAEYEPNTAAEITGIPAEEIIDAATTYATRVDPSTGYGNGGILYTLGVEHGCNAIQNCRLLDGIVAITGNWDVPGGSRGGTLGRFFSMPQSHSTAIPEPPVEQFDKIIGGDDFPLLKWWQWWSDAAYTYNTMLSGDPYPIRGGICQSGDFMNMANSLNAYEAMNSLDFYATINLWHDPMTECADIVMPTLNWLEVDCARISQGGSGAEGATQAAIDPPGECKHDYEIAIGIYKACGVPYHYEESDPWPDWRRLLEDTVRQTKWDGWDDYIADFQENGWRDCKELYKDSWGTYRRYETGQLIDNVPFFTREQDSGRYKRISGEKPGFFTPTNKIELWSTVMESCFPNKDDIIGDFFEPPLGPVAAPEEYEEYPFTCITGRRIPVYFHSEQRQLPWCRELWPVPRMEINPVDAEELGVEQGDWVWIENKQHKIRQVVDLYPGIEPGVVNCEHQWWYPELEQADKGFHLSGVNCLVTDGYETQDRHCANSYLRGYPVKIYKATPENSPFNNPIPCGDDGTEIITTPQDPRLKEWLPVDFEEVEA